MPITIYKERQQRRRRAAELFAGGLSLADAASRLTAELKGSRRTSLRDIDLGQDALLESIDSQTHAQAEKAHQYGAAIGALKGWLNVNKDPTAKSVAAN